MIRAKKTTDVAAVMPWENGGMMALPWQSLTALSYQCYALLIIIALLWPMKQKLTVDSSERLPDNSTS